MLRECALTFLDSYMEFKYKRRLQGSTRAVQSSKTALLKSANLMLTVTEDMYPASSLHREMSKKEASR